MSDSTPPPHGGQPFPPPPPPPPGSKGTSGCLKYGLIGCGALVALVILAIVAGAIWFDRNRDVFVQAAGSGVQEGARLGLTTDEAGCVDAGMARMEGVASITEGVAIGSFVRGCLEFSRETEGFCETAEPPAALRQVVRDYCASGRVKRTAADTLDWAARGAAPDTAGGGF